MLDDRVDERPRKVQAALHHSGKLAEPLHHVMVPLLARVDAPVGLASRVVVQLGKVFALLLRARRGRARPTTARTRAAQGRRRTRLYSKDAPQHVGKVPGDCARAAFVQFFFWKA
jgi:hypothetical protein